MGCDGGTIPKRHELIRTKKKREVKDRESDLQWRWRYCSLTHQELLTPIVACELGRLYNKEAVIEFLLDKSSSKDQFNHLKGLKDVHSLVLTRNPAWQGGSLKGDSYIDTHLAPYICPVAGIEMNGRYKFNFLLGCKCVVSDRAIKEVRGSSCPSCSTEYRDCDVIILNPTEEEERVLFEQMEKRREIARAERLKKKKEKKRGNKKGGSGGSSTETATKQQNSGTSGHQNGVPGTSGHQPGTSGHQKEVPTSGHQRGTSGPRLASERVKSLGAASAVSGAKRKLKEEKIFHTKTFRSLFTTHESARGAKDKNGHWITYNPYHYAG